MESLNDDISGTGTGGPIDFLFDARVEFDESYTTVCHMTRPWVKIKVTEVWKLRKWPISKSISFANMHAINKLTANCGTPRQYLIFYTDFGYSSSFGIT